MDSFVVNIKNFHFIRFQMRLLKTGIVLILVILFFSADKLYAQVCTTLGQTPSTAFPVCGTTAFEQENVPICSTDNLFVPGCTDGANYANKNPFWYKFTCYVSGSLGFVITPKDLTDDYDWQLYDVTGLNPMEVFTNRNIIISGNWAGNPGTTGTSASGANFIQCASSYDGNEPRFAAMPNLIAGHEYILLVSHYTDSQSGYSLSFGGGSAVITDPTVPKMQKATVSCDGKKITLLLNKKLRCNSLTADGTEFSLFPANSNVIAAVATNCTSGFDFDSLVITLNNPLTAGNYQLIINEGSDGTTLLDNCGSSIQQNEKVSFTYNIPQPIFADSVGKTGCQPNALKIFFPKRIDCSSIAANGSDFIINGPTPVTVSGASGSCDADGLSSFINVTFSSPIYTKGNYTVTLKAGTDGNTAIDECGLITPVQTLAFSTADTVSAVFDMVTKLGCTLDTVAFSHNGAHDVNKWAWSFNTTNTANTRGIHTILYPATSNNTVQLTVSNGVCTNTQTRNIVFDNEVKASFTIPSVICPEDPLVINNTSNGLVDLWQWNFGTFGNSSAKDPLPVQFPNTNIETSYLVKLSATNTSLRCTDVATKTIKVLNNCFIAVPTAFTPNNDGLNDFLSPNNAIKADNLHFTVFNRWGQKVFETRDWTQKWNGKINGIVQASGVYVWMLEYTHRDTGKKIFQKGTTTLIR